MSRLTDSPWMWTRNEGAPSSISGEHVLPLTALPEGMVSSATNVDLDERGIFIPRKGITTFSTVGTPPTAAINSLFTYRNGTTDELFAFTASTLNHWDGSTWASLALSDTSGFDADTMAIHYNGKVFLAYNSTQNRLHVLASGVVRRVGIGLVAAATVANTGAGTYAATLRYYKIQMRIHLNADASQARLASSELSAVVSFTPSGAGTAARITKPTTIDSSTHWTVYASGDGITFYDISGSQAVGTTTWDDTIVVANYPAASAGVAPEVGLFVPPPSARFIVSDGTRLLMAGAHETTAAAGETTPSVKRVWFTRPMGATDKGDDEAITQTTDRRYYIDIDDPANTTITGLASIGGVVYVFFTRAVWRLVPSGVDGSPYRAEQVSATVGAMRQPGIAVGGSTTGTEDAVYFVSQFSGLHRVSTARGLEWLGRDVCPRVLTSDMVEPTLEFNPVTLDLWMWMVAGGAQANPRVVSVPYLKMRGDEYHGGARIMSFAGPIHKTGVFFNGGMVFGGQTAAPAALLDSYSGLTDNGTNITATVRGPVLRLPLQRLAVEEPTLQSFGVATTVTVGLADRFAAAADARTVDLALPASSDGYIARVAGLVLSDALSVQPSLTWTGTDPGVIVEALAFPFTTREAL